MTITRITFIVAVTLKLQGNDRLVVFPNFIKR